MKGSTVAWLLLAGVVLYELFRLNVAKNLVFYPGSVNNLGFSSVSVGNPEIDFTLLVQNTSAVPVEVDSLAGNIYSNNTLIGNISSFVPTVIPGNGQAQVPVTGSLMFIGIVSDLVSAFSNKTASQDIAIKGNVNVQGAQVPLDIEMHIGT